MDSDPSQIPVLPIPFEHGLTRFAQSLTRGRPKIVAIGSSTTAGEGGIRAYPERLLSFLQGEYPNPKITMVNQGIGGQEAPSELLRFDTDVIAEKPDLVIWQVGTNAVWQPADQHPPSIDETTTAIRDGLVKLRDENGRYVGHFGEGGTRSGLEGPDRPGPILLQGDHGPVAYRNIMTRPL